MGFRFLDGDPSGLFPWLFAETVFLCCCWTLVMTDCEQRETGVMVSPARVERATIALKVRCSTN